MRFFEWPLLWRVFAINAGLLTLAFLLLAFTPVTVSARIGLFEALILGIGLAVILAANLVLLKPSFAPLEQLAEQMHTVDLLSPGQRLPVGNGSAEIAELVAVFNQMLDRLEAERRESGRRALAAQEAERLRISADLHDGVGQILTGVLLQLNATVGSVSPGQRVELSETQQALHQALDEVRRIARELRPEMLEDLGLVSALTELATTFARQSRIRTVPRFATELPKLTRESELTVYRVAQESLTNVGRHANASRVELSLERDANCVVLRVADNGHGFQPGADPDRHGGIRGMRERAAYAGGTLAIRSASAGGVEVTLTVPTKTTTKGS
jgi:two-component system sensor histidine kinase UhpB